MTKQKHQPYVRKYKDLDSEFYRNGFLDLIDQGITPRKILDGIYEQITNAHKQLQIFSYEFPEVYVSRLYPICDPRFSPKVRSGIIKGLKHAGLKKQ